MDLFSLEIPGKPISLKRPRYFNGVVYDSQKALKKKYLILLSSQISTIPLVENSINLILYFYFEYPKYMKRKNINHLVPKISKPDLDNLIKWPLDLFNRILWKDDAQIYSIQSYKLYGPQSKTVLVIQEEEIS